MGEQTPHKEPLLKNPQVLGAILGTITTIVVAVIGIVPSIIEASLPPTLTPTPIVVTATPLVASATFTPLALDATATTVALIMTDSVLPTNTPLIIPSSTATDMPTATETAIPSATVVTQSANITLIWDIDSFTVLNAAGQQISLEGITFQSSNGTWQASQWGNTIYNALPVAKCLRLRDAAVGNRQPPAPCNNNIWGLMQVGTSAFFWKNVNTFDVVLNGAIINTCEVSAGTCGIYVEP